MGHVLQLVTSASDKCTGLFLHSLMAGVLCILVALSNVQTPHARTVEPQVH